MIYERLLTTNDVNLLLIETGNSTLLSWDYFNIGASFDLIEHN